MPPKLKAQGYGLTEATTRGWRGHPPSLSTQITHAPAGTHIVAFRRKAVHAYRVARENGTSRDNPSEAFPEDGTYTWEDEGAVKSKMRYTGGRRDAAWMAHKDRNFIARLEHEDEARRERLEAEKRKVAEDAARRQKEAKAAEDEAIRIRAEAPAKEREERVRQGLAEIVRQTEIATAAWGEIRRQVELADASAEEVQRITRTATVISERTQIPTDIDTSERGRRQTDLAALVLCEIHGLLDTARAAEAEARRLRGVADAAVVRAATERLAHPTDVAPIQACADVVANALTESERQATIVTAALEVIRADTANVMGCMKAENFYNLTLHIRMHFGFENGRGKSETTVELSNFLEDEGGGLIGRGDNMVTDDREGDVRRVTPLLIRMVHPYGVITFERSETDVRLVVGLNTKQEAQMLIENLWRVFPPEAKVLGFSKALAQARDVLTIELEREMRPDSPRPGHS